MDNKIKVELELNEYQIKLIRSWLGGAQDNLHDQRSEWGCGVSDYDEQYRLTYGTDDYDEAQTLLEDIQNQLPNENLHGSSPPHEL